MSSSDEGAAPNPSVVDANGAGEAVAPLLEGSAGQDPGQDAGEAAPVEGNGERRKKVKRKMTDQELQEEMEEHADVVLTVMKPVTITMVVVVAVVKLITLPTGPSADGYLLSDEQGSSGSESVGEKLGGALLNAAIVLGAILVSTIAFVILYKCRCMKLIFGWLIMSSTFLLGGLGAALLYLIANSTNMALDYISFSFIAWNFAIVGVTSVFWHAPLKFQQGYLICISSLLAIFMTRLPEWTTFAILAVVAVYDLFSVLCPNGPLRVLVEEAQSRNESIPALLYSASVFIMMAEPVEGIGRALQMTTSSDEELENSDEAEDDANNSSEGDDNIAVAGDTDTQEDDEAKRQVRRERRRRRKLRQQRQRRRAAGAPDGAPSSSSPARGRRGDAEAPRRRRRDAEEEEEEPQLAGKGIKLGLGDFIFYSVLIGRAAMFDMSTVFTCFIAVITGLFLTLLLLAVFRKALPALPISIGLGLIFYFVTRVVLLPFIIQLASVQVFV